MVNRVIVGAHYGLRDWLVQRITAVVMAMYTFVVLGVVLIGPPITFIAWRELFASGWMRVATLLFAVSLAWHAWVGVRDIIMDYVKSTAVRLVLESVVLLTID